ncbi:DNA-binding transcriptional regulator, MarR family [Paenibacillus sophorae]|uniref:DNA-binding transcriptional regulator, MarR family n=2 Tax=Paenibacillus sophorae TaxID=1333845 RepID=A0A1H8IHL1_9BACL|nr:MarR family transcriptional regulator [Paenibacillus sophorae]QWU15962.1 MarR family transcriptional regulator [Paenibacillus sophorae]SEN67762.1 DNA-binding transcriptional regulator, MarR family [Paenibacillus sophorae]
MPHKLLFALQQLHKAHWRHAAEGNKPSETTLMMCIARNTHFGKQGLKVSEISRLLGLTPPTVTQLINSLEVKEMVLRQADPEDRRVVRVNLTERGCEVAKKAKKHRDATLSKLVDYLGEEDSNRLADLLIKVHTFLQEQDHTLDLERLSTNGDENND